MSEQPLKANKQHYASVVISFKTKEELREWLQVWQAYKTRGKA
jgi:hypothetical protein